MTIQIARCAFASQDETHSIILPHYIKNPTVKNLQRFLQVPLRIPGRSQNHPRTRKAPRQSTPRALVRVERFEIIRAALAKSMGQQVVGRDDENLPEIGAGHVDRELAELAEHLSAHAAGRGQPAVDPVGDDADGPKAALALADGLGDGRALGAYGHGVRGVLDVAAGPDVAVGATEGRADLELAVRRVGVGAGLEALADQLLGLRVCNDPAEDGISFIFEEILLLGFVSLKI